MKKLNFFLDIDDTLMPSGKTELSAQTLDAILKARALGCRFFINTGRPYSDIPLNVFTEEYFDGICSGGDYAVFHGRPIYAHFMPKCDVRELLKALMGMKKKINFNIGGLSHRYYIGDFLPYFNKDIYVPLIGYDDFDKRFPEEYLQKYVISEPLSPDSDLLPEIKKYFSVIFHPSYTEGFLHGHSKSFLIKKVEEELSLPHECTVAIGDSLNDTDMLEYASISVAMGNAPKEVKELCTFVTDTSENDGVAKAILKLISEESNR